MTLTYPRKTNGLKKLWCKIKGHHYKVIVSSSFRDYKAGAIICENCFIQKGEKIDLGLINDTWENGFYWGMFVFFIGWNLGTLVGYLIQ